jgi:hypothetical protein
MDKIIDLQKRLKTKKDGEILKQHQGKIETLSQIIQCSSCRLKCAMCGEHLGSVDTCGDRPPAVTGLTLCKNCKDEYNDFLSISDKKDQPDVFWHNKEWYRMWSAWIDYRKSIVAFMKSPEFKRLLKEIDADR